jgi:hypothetical protein
VLLCPSFFLLSDNTYLALLRFAGLIVSRYRLFGGGRHARAATHKYTMKARQINSEDEIKNSSVFDFVHPDGCEQLIATLVQLKGTSE